LACHPALSISSANIIGSQRDAIDYGLRLNNRQRIANATETPIEANKNQSVDGAEGLFLRSGSPQNVYLLPQRQNFRLERCPRPKQINDHPNNEPDKISHPVTASPDSRSTASQIEFATGTPLEEISPDRCGRGHLPVLGPGGNHPLGMAALRARDKQATCGCRVQVLFKTLGEQAAG
jgi:hypothetical protein